MAQDPQTPPDADDPGPDGAASESQSLEAMLDRLVRNVGALLDVPGCSVELLDPETGDLVTCSALAAPHDAARHSRFAPNEGIAGWVAVHLRPLIVDDAQREPRFKPLGGSRIRSLLCVPLVDGERLLGTLTATSPRPRAFDERRQQLLQVFADQAVLAITKARRAQEAQEQAAELAALLDSATALTSSLDTQQVFGRIVSSLRRVASCDDAVIYAYDEHERALRVVSGLGRRIERLGGARIPLDDPDSIAAWVAQRGTPRLTAPGPIATGQVTEAFLAGDPLALLSVPLVSKERLRGVITLARPFAFTPAELRTMLNLANIVAAALENVELYQAARLEREQLAAIFAAGSDGIAIVDAAVVITEANAAFAALVGIPRERLIGQRVCTVLDRRGSGCDLCRGPCLVERALESGEALPHVECELPAAADGTGDPAGAAGPAAGPPPPNQVSQPQDGPTGVRFVDLSVTPVNAPQGRRALLIGRDVTALREMDRMKAHFLSMVSHELLSPLQAVNVHLDVALSDMVGGLTPEQRELVRRARVGSEHLTALVQDLLLISRLDAGQFRLNRHVIRLDEVLEEAREEVELMAADAGIAFSLRCQPGLPPVEADGPRLRQVLRNLLTNAIKFTPGGGEVVLAATYDAAYMRLSVSDTGVGIAAEHLPRIFDRFYQVPATNARSRGQGLGLAIAHIIVEGHGGYLEVQSRPGHGSTFTVFLPRIADDDPAEDAPGE